MITTKKKVKSTNDKINEKIRLDKAYNNYHEIINKNLSFKFSYLDEWLYKKSKLLLNESVELESDKKVKYRVYKRGTIIRVDFGVNLGSEMSQVHFAIVLNQFDNPNNNVLTVIPLTSKKNQYNLNLKNLVIEKMIKKINRVLTTTNYNDEGKIKKLSTLLTYYKSNVKSTYACCSLITTISKTKIFLPINEYDIIGRERCSSEVMDKIDNEIINRFTGIKN